jgi:hypothetical protein
VAFLIVIDRSQNQASEGLDLALEGSDESDEIELNVGDEAAKEHAPLNGHENKESKDKVKVNEGQIDRSDFRTLDVIKRGKGKRPREESVVALSISVPAVKNRALNWIFSRLSFMARRADVIMVKLLYALCGSCYWLHANLFFVNAFSWSVYLPGLVRLPVGFPLKNFVYIWLPFSILSSA